MRALLFVIAAVFLSACQSLTDGAREQVSKAIACPLDRVTAKERPDLDAWQLRMGNVPELPAPPDVAADPQRLAMWKEQQQAKLARPSGYRGVVIEVSACGSTLMMDCFRKNKVRWGESSVSCSELSRTK